MNDYVELLKKNPDKIRDLLISKFTPVTKIFTADGIEDGRLPIKDNLFLKRRGL